MWHFLSVLMFVPVFSVIWAYKVIGVSVRRFKYDARGLAIFLVKNLSSSYWFFVLFVNFSIKYGSYK